MNSMTGFGKAKLEKNGRSYSIEIKSVNHRYCDISVRLPRSISFYEGEVKKFISQRITRGKIDVYIDYANYSAEENDVFINKDLAKIYIKQLKELADQEGLDGNLRAIDISKMPDVLQLKANDSENDEILSELLECLEQALDNFISMRNAEGEKIKQDLIVRIDNIKAKVNEISQNTTGLIDEYVVKLRERIKEILKTDVVDEQRLAQEIVIFADKTSIQEELTRLDSHTHQFEKIINSSESVGKKIDFLLQEMNREANTIASKSVKLEITNLVIEIKTELEDIREQIQNIE